MTVPGSDSWIVESVDPSGMQIRKKKGRGAPVPHRLSLRNGNVLMEFARESCGTVRVPSLKPLARFDFDACPICLSADNMTDEDVPPISIGGSVLTRTCARCNNGLGSRVDSHLVAWWHGECLDVMVHVNGLPGSRNIGAAAVRRSGEVVALLPRRGLPTDVRHALKKSPTSLSLEGWREPDMRCVELAVLKSAYLAACVHRREIVASPSADLIRRNLVEARDGKSEETVRCASPLMFRKGPGEASRQPTRLALMDGDVWISLASVLFVRWPLPDCPP